ncbi:10705_t:CDS:1, partial [Entrophospora sp. SA101]
SKDLNKLETTWSEFVSIVQEMYHHHILLPSRPLRPLRYKNHINTNNPNNVDDENDENDIDENVMIQ